MLITSIEFLGYLKGRLALKLTKNGREKQKIEQAFACGEKKAKQKFQEIFFVAVYHFAYIVLFFRIELISLQYKKTKIKDMGVLNFTTREFRDNQALALNKADAGEQVIIHRGKSKSYIVTPIHDSDFVVGEELQKKIAKAREDYKNGKGTLCRSARDTMALLESL